MKTPVPSSRTVLVLTWVAAVAGLLLTVWLIGRVATLSEDVDDADRLAETRGDILDDLSGVVADQGAALDAANQKLIVLGEEPVDPPDVTVPVSPLQGPMGPVGPVGPRGPKGDTGNEGDDGTSGPVGVAGEQGATGPQGPPGPAGPAGADGKDGAPGADGRGLQSLTCEDGQLVATYTDGTTQIVDGAMCLPANPGKPGGTP